MKAILISIQPKYVAKILNKEKLLEIRKRFPKDYRGWVYIYCSKSNTQYLVGSKTQKCEIITKSPNARFNPNIDEYTGNGKVVARFKLKEVNEYNLQFAIYSQHSIFKDGIYHGELEGTKNDLVDLACLTPDEILAYAGDNEKVYAIHISQLEIFDRPKELSEFMHIIGYTDFGGFVKTEYGRLTKAPQSWQYVEVKE